MTDHATQVTSTEPSSTSTQSNEPLNQRITSGEADLDEFRERLTLWLAGRVEVDSDAGVEVSAVSRPKSSGMSNISVLFDAAWTPAGSSERRSAELVARMCPQDDAFPVFPVYDLQKQFDVILHWLSSTFSNSGFGGWRAETGLPHNSG